MEGLEYEYPKFPARPKVYEDATAHTEESTYATIQPHKKANSSRHRTVNSIVAGLCLILSMSALAISLVNFISSAQPAASGEKVSSAAVIDSKDVKDNITTVTPELPSTTAAVKTCTDDYRHNPFSNTCVGIYTQKKSWGNSKNFCENMGEHLVTIRSVESLYWLINQRKTDQGWDTEPTWTGGAMDELGTWRWHGLSTEPTTFINWGANEPNNQRGNQGCASIWSTGTFDDSECYQTYNFFCES